MKAEYINPFIESVESLFSTMIGCSVDRGTIAVSERCAEGGDITALIGLSGPARGTVALSFPMATAQKVVSRLLQVGETEADENVSDGVAELVNIVAGQAKAKFYREDGPTMDLSLPTVVRGQEYSIATPPNTSWLDVPFRSELGSFRLRISFIFNQ